MTADTGRASLRRLARRALRRAVPPLRNMRAFILGTLLRPLPGTRVTGDQDGA